MAFAFGCSSRRKSVSTPQSQSGWQSIHSGQTPPRASRIETSLLLRRLMNAPQGGCPSRLQRGFSLRALGFFPRRPAELLHCNQDSSAIFARRMTGYVVRSSRERDRLCLELGKIPGTILQSELRSTSYQGWNGIWRIKGLASTDPWCWEFSSK